MNNLKYKLINGEVIICDDLIEWAKWFENTEERIIAQTEIGNARVSTVFLGLDHNFSNNGPPLLFETTVFKSNHYLYCARYSNLKEAQNGHDHVVAGVKMNNSDYEKKNLSPISKLKGIQDDNNNKSFE